jgi:hypothetical protein
MKYPFLPLAIIAISVPGTGYAEDTQIVEMAIEVAKAKGIEPVPLVSILKQESGDPKRGFALNPYALNVKGRSYYPASKSEAYAIIHEAMISGKNSVGVGLGQVEWLYHAESFDSYWDALGVEKNLDVTSDYLKKMLKRCGGNYACAVGSYHNMNKKVGYEYLSYVAKRCRDLYSQKECEVLDEKY